MENQVVTHLWMFATRKTHPSRVMLYECSTGRNFTQSGRRIALSTSPFRNLDISVYRQAPDFFLAASRCATSRSDRCNRLYQEACGTALPSSFIIIDEGVSIVRFFDRREDFSPLNVSTLPSDGITSEVRWAPRFCRG